ncbi:DUF6215 domain-containing protein [Streptomyces sp. KLOTTS4A1]|uniref:DUF6215 domain-containing protein n=1 Tax=Streptomyces sp. KLOTTS4A1 TaxID=3390996 RepID=UPI0039F48C06
MSSGHGVRAKEPSTWKQVVAGLLLVPGVGFALWAQEQTSSPVRHERRPAVCSDAADEREPTKSDRARVNGDRLCESLNRPDLARLLGTPDEMAKHAYGSEHSMGQGRDQVVIPTARVEFETYTVELSVDHSDFRVTGAASALYTDARQRKILGRPAVVHSQQTIRIGFRLDGGDVQSGPGVTARTVSVARDARDSGGSYDVTVWRNDGGLPSDEALFRVAETVLPDVPGWNAGR